MNAEERREQRLKLLEDDIGRHLRESESCGELKAAPSYGKPLNFGDGYDETPDDLRMPMKVLKDAGVQAFAGRVGVATLKGQQRAHQG